MARALWKGSLSFGLVSIGIELYAATQEHVLGFRILHSKCKNPISNKRWCSFCEQEVQWDQTEKGIKLKDGSYFVITKESLKKLRPEKTDYIEILEFIDKNQIPTIYFDHHYYVLPSAKSDKSYFLFSKSLEHFTKIAVGRFVMKDKEYICIIEPYKKALSLSTLNYAYEIKKIPEIDELRPPKTIDSEELELAQLLMKRLYNEKFDISKYKDTFVQKLLKNIMSAKKGKKIAIKKEKEKIEKPSLVSALKESLEKYKEPKSVKK